MRHGKMKTLYGLYKAIGRDAFLEAVKQYSGHAYDTVEAALADMESRWFDEDHALTEADIMILDYNSGRLRGFDSIETSSSVTTKMEVLA